MRSACWTFKGSNVLKSRPSAQSSMKLAFVSHLCHDLPHATQRARHSSFLIHRSGRLWLASFRHLLLVIVALGLLAGQSGNAQPPFPFTPPPPPKPFPLVSQIFGDNMVLQRGKTSTFWGWADAGDKITVEIGDRTATGVAGADRLWEAKIQPPAPGGPYTVKITGSGANESVELHNVLVGDVWLCGGQSNMGLPSRMTECREEVIRRQTTLRSASLLYAGTRATTTPASAAVGKSFRLKQRPGFRPSLIFLRAESSRISTCPSAWLWMRWVELPAETWTSAAALRTLKDFDESRWPKSIGWPSSGRARVRQLHQPLVRRIRHRPETKLGRSRSR